MLESLMHGPQLLDRPEEPFQPRFRHQRRHTKRPELVGVEAQTGRQIRAGDPRWGRRIGRR